MNKKRKAKSKHRNDLLALLRILSLISPLAVYILFITWIFPAPNSGFIAMVCVGSFVIGIGMINIIGLVDNTYLGNTITAKIMAPGICLVVISSIVMYVPAIYSKLNEEHVTFYFLIWILLMVSILYYPFFRHAVGLDLQKKGLSKTRIKKSMEGRRNYWWYDSLKGDMSSRWIHIVNKLFTIAFLCTGIVHLLIGWWSVVFPVITIATCFLLLLNSMMGILFITTWDQTKKYRNRASPLGLVAWVGMPIIWCYALIKYYLTMLQ